MSIIDVVIILTAIAYAAGGYHNGAIVGLFSLVGFFGGGVLGAQLARPLGTAIAGGTAQVPVAIGSVLIAALAGQLLAVWVAGRIKGRVTWRQARAVDSGIGAVLGIVSVLLVAWMVAVPLAYSPYPGLASAVRRSTIVRSIDAAMPSGVRDVYSSLRTFIDRSGFPPFFGIQPTRIVDVGPPDPALVRSAAVTRARASTFKVIGDAPSCDRRIEGSSFAYAPDRLLTNAHVVAGTRQIRVLVGSGTLSARVVLFDPRRDVAVLDVPGLDAPVLPFTPAPVDTGASAIVVGFPEDGPFDVRAARIRERERVSGQTIYGASGGVRDIYSLRTLVRSGNSGGPLVAPDGSVLGMVFATAVDSSDTGFALTDAEIAADASAGRTASASVSTGACTD